MDPIELTPQIVTPEAFAAYGHVIAVGSEAPHDALHFGTGAPRLWVMALADRRAQFDRITRHGSVTQCLASADANPWFIAVAAPAADPTSPGAIEAFTIPAGTAIVLQRGTWHAGPYFTGATANFFNFELADTNDVDHDTVTLPTEHRLVITAPESAPNPARRILVVANRTAASPQLLASLRRLSAAGIGSIRVVVPVTNPTTIFQTMAAASDPLAGLPPMAPADLPLSFEAATKEAEQRLAGLLDELANMGVKAEGAVGASDPLEAIAGVLSRHPADEILLSTLPAGLSRWLSRDLPSRCAKRFGLPVTHVEASVLQ